MKKQEASSHYVERKNETSTEQTTAHVLEGGYQNNAMDTSISASDKKKIVMLFRENRVLSKNKNI